MEEKTNDKMMTETNNSSIFSKIKIFFKSLFLGKNTSVYQQINYKENEENSNSQVENKETNSFLNSIKVVETEETKLLKLQKQFRAGEIKEADLTEEQKDSLCDLYDKQIAEIKQSIEVLKQKLNNY